MTSHLQVTTWYHTKHDSDKSRHWSDNTLTKEWVSYEGFFVSILWRNDLVIMKLSEFGEKYPLGRVKTEPLEIRGTKYLSQHKNKSTWKGRFSYIIHNIKCHLLFNTLRPRQNGRQYADDIFKCIFLYINCCILIEISLKFVPYAPTNNNPAFVQIMDWYSTCKKPLYEPMMA